MRLLALIPLTLALVIAGCGGNSSQVSFTPSPSNPSPNPGGGDNGGNPGGGNNPGNPGGNNGGGNGGGNNGQDPDYCGYQSIADRPAFTPEFDVANTNNLAIYDAEQYTAIADGIDLTGTWVMTYQQNDSGNTGGSDSSRTPKKIDERAIFVIRDSGGTIEVANCSRGGFMTISNTSSIPLPAFYVELSHPIVFESVGTSELQPKVAINGVDIAVKKISSSTSALGASEIDINNSPTSADDIWCVSQNRTHTFHQMCAAGITKEVVSLTMSVTTNAAHDQKHHFIVLNHDLSSQETVLGLSSSKRILVSDDINDVTQTLSELSQGTVSLFNAFYCEAGELNPDGEPLGCLQTPSNPKANGTWEYELSLPAEIPLL